MTLIEEGNYLLGDVPKEIEKEDVLSYFLYTFELSWKHPMFDDKRGFMMNYFLGEFQKDEIDFESLSHERKWWLCVLTAMREIAKHNNAEFAIQTIQHVIRTLPSADPVSIRDYVNMIHSIALQEFLDVLIVRPLEMERVNSLFARTDKTIRFFLDKRDEIVNVFQKHITSKDFQKLYFDEVLLKDRSIMKKYTNDMDMLFEFFLHYFTSIYDYRINPEQMDEKELEKSVKELVLIFMIATIKTKSKIDKLHEEVYAVIKDVKNLSADSEDEEDGE